MPPVRTTAFSGYFLLAVAANLACGVDSVLVNGLIPFFIKNQASMIPMTITDHFIAPGESGWFSHISVVSQRT